ncbi:MAG: U32 family peptidase, partial [Candidatus Riflebacteria bacterium]|nr:U32 family peptidase [Candidatus Riflebacteria bacterium]
MNNKPELLAPAGSEESLKAAILAGADAVYLAGKHFGARAFASNFDEEGLKWARRVTKASNKKLYITLNTIVFDHEWPLLCKTLDFLENLQPDSLIIQDLGIAVELRKRNSKIPLHLSTQGAWFGQGGIEELKELGFTRIILPRETSRKEIADIVKNSPFEIEVFVHGAMCYSISGRCFWSCSLGPRSGNRGTCAQPCRREYAIGEYCKLSPIFSPKDLRLIKDINKLTETGVSSLKIEGRMKSPEYVYQVVKAYREAIDGKKVNENKNLDEVFSRASSSGFFFGIQKPSEWKTGKNQGREGYIVGITTGNTSNGLVEIELKDNINQGDGLFWFNANNEKEGSIITFVKTNPKNKNIILVRGLPNRISKNTELRRTSKNDDENWKSLWDKSLERIPIELAWTGKENSSLCV